MAHKDRNDHDDNNTSISKTSEIVDVEVFTKSLQARPLRESSRIAAEKLKSVLKGKYNVCLHDDDDTDLVEVPFEDQGLNILKNGENWASSEGGETSSVQDDNSVASDAPSKCFSVLSETDLEQCEFDIFMKSVEDEDASDPYLLDNYWTTKTDQMEEDEFLRAIDHLLSITDEMAPPRFRFEVSSEAAEENLQLLRRGGYDWDGLLYTNPTSVTSFGSEFKAPQDLDCLLSHHPRWNQLRHRLNTAVHFPLEPITEAQRKADLTVAVQKGNHRSAKNNHKFLADAMAKEIQKGWSLPLPGDCHDEIPEIIINPMGVQDHMGVTENGTFRSKKRVTHNLSNEGEYSGKSVNSRVIEEEMLPCMFGYCLLRVVHFIVNLRRRHLFVRIVLRKDDLKSAYKRFHLDWISAVRSAVRVLIMGVHYILISLRLPFGGSPCPPEFCLLTDIITDTVNDLLCCKSWNPIKISSDFTVKVPQATFLPDEIPFGQARSMSVSLPDEDHGKADVFIDDIITTVPDIGDNILRARAAPCTVLHAVCSNCSDPHVTRDEILADDKNEAEGAPSEIKIVLGWEINTRTLMIALPQHKYKAWDSELDNLSKCKTADQTTLQRVLGRLENVATVIPALGHFLNNIRQLEIKAGEKNGHNVRISRRARKDMQYVRRFLRKAANGVSLNTIVFRDPDVTWINDACEHGLGAYADHGRAWTYLLPEELRGRAHINTLEFLTQVVSVWLDILEHRLHPLDCILSVGDSTSAMGWLRRSNFREKDESDEEWKVKQQIARKLGDLLLDHDLVLYRQWLKGDFNIVSDSLSRDAYFLPPHAHKLFFKILAPTQIPENFNIKPVPNEIASFIISILRQLPVKKQRLLPLKRSDLAHGNVGVLSYCLLASQKALSSKTSLTSPEILSSAPSVKPSDSLPSLKEIKNAWLKGQSQPPSQMWFRPSGQGTRRTPDWTLTGAHAFYWKNKNEVGEMKTEPSRKRKLSPS